MKIKRYRTFLHSFKIFNLKNGNNGDWGLGIGDWGLGIGPNPQSPIPNPNPQSPFLFYVFLYTFEIIIH